MEAVTWRCSFHFLRVHLTNAAVGPHFDIATSHQSSIYGSRQPILILLAMLFLQITLQIHLVT